eukprot:scaffold40257_cov33-Phaeocystis_antarctica.AAC.1
MQTAPLICTGLQAGMMGSQAGMHGVAGWDGGVAGWTTGCSMQATHSEPCPGARGGCGAGCG